MSASEAIGSLFGVLGAALVAWGGLRCVRLGFVAYAVSNVAWMAFASQAQAVGMLAMNAVFMLTTGVGLWRAFKPSR